MNALERELHALIASEGPITVARYMALCLGHPRHGYYVTRDPFGAQGDFTTAPEISQIFGELLGLWAASVWQSMGAPDRVLLAELGPGRGTLMADALRACKVVPDFRAALSVHLVETSPVLRERQRAALADCGVAIIWHEHAADLPAGPLIVLANEFIDALPIHQAVKTPSGWHERCVALVDGKSLQFALSPTPMAIDPRSLPTAIALSSHAGPHPVTRHCEPTGPARSGRPDDRLREAIQLVPCQPADRPADWIASSPSLLAMTNRTSFVQAPIGAVMEWRDDDLIASLSQRVREEGGALLFIDYGYDESAPGDTFQAVRSHGFADPLQSPGECDLTAHVDFAALARMAERCGACPHGPVAQGAFLERLGIHARADRLKTAATENQRRAIEAAVARLTGTGSSQMGNLFRVLAVSHPALHSLPGFAAR